MHLSSLIREFTEHSKHNQISVSHKTGCLVNSSFKPELFMSIPYLELISLASSFNKPIIIWVICACHLTLGILSMVYLGFSNILNFVYLTLM